MAQDSVSAYTPLLFSHPRVGSLKIDTGMTSISWSYGLNTRSDQTYGGEVVQVLSCYADQMTITGETRSNAQLQQIYDWFRSYMEQAGLHRRDERHVLFEYPERKWRFWIQPTQAPAMRFGTDLIATPWSMTAEIVQDDVEANALVEHTMSNFTSSILDKNFFDIGFQNFDPRNDPNGYPGPSFSQGLADNYQALLGSWAGGDYAHWGFDPLQSTSANNLPENTKDYWMKLLGTDYVAGNQNAGIAGGSVVYTGGPKTTDPVQIAGLIKSVLQLHGYQNWAWLAIAIGLTENGGRLDPNSRGNPASIGLFQPQVPPLPSRVSKGDPHYQDLRNAANHPNDPVVNYYTTQAQVEDFCSADWFLNPSYIEQSHPAVWATNAQGPADTAGYQQKVMAAKAQAESLLKKFNDQGGLPSGTAQQLAHEILNSNKITYDPGVIGDLQDTAAGRSVFVPATGQRITLNIKVLQIILSLVDSGWTLRLSALASNHHDDGPHGHVGGFCVDINYINGTQIGSSPGIGDLLHRFLRRLHDGGPLLPRQLISGGFDGHSDSTCRALSIPPNGYDSSTFADHENHVHVGY